MKKNNKSPKGKTTSIEVANKRRAEAEARCMARRTQKLKKAGATDEQIKKLIEDENARTILCIYYGSHMVDIGEQEVTKKKYNKETKKYEEVTEKQNVTLRGRQAAEYSIREKGLEVIAFSSTHCFIKTTKDKAKEIATDLRKDIGRCYITKHTEKKEEPKKEKTPTNNTLPVRKTTKKKRKEENEKNTEMRPYYAAKRKGGVSKRIKKFNPTLAKKIEKWLDEQKKREAAKAEAVDKHKRDHRQMSSAEMKHNKRARKEAKRKAAQERRRAKEKARMENNIKLHAKRAQKAQKPVQTELKMAA